MTIYQVPPNEGKPGCIERLLLIVAVVLLVLLFIKIAPLWT